MERWSFFQENGPIFIFLGGEWGIDGIEEFLIDGSLSRLGKEFGGALFVIEHRFYGKSNPFNTTKTEYFEYLSLEQVLADNAYFIASIRETDPRLKNSKVITIGASYSAALSSWMRLKYPELVVGAWASSPANENVMEFPGKSTKCIQYSQYLI